MVSTATDKATPIPKRKRRWFQFGLRTLLVLVTVACLVLGLWVQRAERQRRAVAFVWSLGGGVAYEGETDTDARVAPEWLRELIAEDYFRTAIGIGLNNTKVSDAGLARLKGLTRLRGLNLENTQVSDAGLEHLKCLTRLQVLVLNNTRVSDAGLEHLKGLTGLQWLGLDGTQVSDAGVAELRAALPGCHIEGPE